MVKNKNLTYVDLLSSFFKFDIFTKKISAKLLIIYDLVLLLIISLLGIVSNNLGNYPLTSNFKMFFSILFGLPILIFFLFGLFYIFLNAYEVKRKFFYEAYLVFCSILFPFVIIGNLFNIIGIYSLNTSILLISLVLLLITIIYFLINFVIHFKNYYSVSAYKIVSSLLIILFMNLAFIAVNYTTYIITLING